MGLVICHVQVLYFSDEHFSPHLQLPRITAETPLRQVGRLSVQQLQVDSKRGLGVAFRTKEVQEGRFQRNIEFHCFVVMPLHGRQNDYLGIHTTESYSRRSDPEKLERLCKEFLERTQRIVAYTFPVDSPRLKRVVGDYERESYRLAIHNHFGQLSEKPFTVWQIVEDEPTPWQTRLFYVLLTVGILLLCIVLLMANFSVRECDMVKPTPRTLREWMAVALHYFLLLLPVLLSLLYLPIAEWMGRSITTVDGELALASGVPSQQLLVEGAWWRLLVAPFFPYNLQACFVFAWFYGLYVYYNKLPLPPLVQFFVYWFSSVLATFCKVMMISPTEMGVSLFSGFVGVWAFHLIWMLLHALCTAFNEQRREEEVSVQQRVNDFMTRLVALSPETMLITLFAVLFYVMVFMQPPSVYVPYSVAAFIGFVVGWLLFIYGKNRGNSAQL